MVYAKTLNVKIASGLSRTSKDWSNHQITWDVLVEKLRKNQCTNETVAQFKNMTKPERDEIKDVGGFVGGNLRLGRRKVENVISRSLVTLDADYAKPSFVEKVKFVLKCEHVIYSTHSHTPENPRLRLVIPLDREVSPDEYGAISRRLAHTVGMEQFDDTTYQTHRLMYWPSSCCNGEVIFEHSQGDLIDVDSILATYTDWKDSSSWPISERSNSKIQREVKKQENPLEKYGVIGAFCRTYNIHEAIDKFLDGEYIESTLEGRYTYAKGSTVNGIRTYDDVFSFSEHNTDPTSGILCNAWDLVRIHKFKDLDDEAGKDTTINKLPSFIAMQDLVGNDKEVKKLMMEEKLADAREAFEDYGVELQEDTGEWRDKLERNKAGTILKTLTNCMLILNNDKNLKSIKYNSHSESIEVYGELPWKHLDRYWRDADDAQLTGYYAIQYGIESKNTILTALAKVSDDRKFHPVKDYFESLPEWDGIDRAETVFIDYLGVKDNKINKEMTLKTLGGAVARIFVPGIKFDTMLVLKGLTGTKKSTIIQKLAGEWFSDSFKFSDTKDKTGAELIQGYWIIEIGELAGLRGANLEIMKSFLSRQNDIYRASYGRRTSPHKRQCIFIGTTNEDEFLMDPTGNRRIWIMEVRQQPLAADIDKDLTQYEINQIWAEVIERYKKGEKIFFDSDEFSSEIEIMHEESFINDPVSGPILDFVNAKVPEGWDEYDMSDRKSYWRDSGEFLSDKETILVPRTKISALEIWCELLNGDIVKMDYKESRRIKDILKRVKGWKEKAGIRTGKMYGVQRGFVRE